jgi:mitochondrial fission protein ELM1
MPNEARLQRGSLSTIKPRARKVSMVEQRPIVIWAVSDGRAGMQNQVLGVAEALQRRTPASIAVKRITVDPAVENWPTFLWGNPFRHLTRDSDRLEPPWPDVFIGCGRRVVPFAKALKAHCFTVQTQDPRAKPKDFGMVVPPMHDRLRGPGVVPIQGSPNRLTKERLKLEGALLAASLPDHIRWRSPFAACLIGGPSKDYRWNEEVENGIIAAIAAAIEAGYAVLATTSRRTPAAFRERLEYHFKPKNLWLWNGQPVGAIENPYFGLLGLSERILVTEESANMITEAAFTGKPVHLMKLAGGGAKWKRFHEALEERGVLRPRAGMTETWKYAPLRETDRVADEIVKRLTARGVIQATI